MRLRSRSLTKKDIPRGTQSRLSQAIFHGLLFSLFALFTACSSQHPGLERARDQSRAYEADQARRNSQASAARVDQLEKQLAEFQAKTTERGLELTLSGVLFEFDRAALKPGALVRRARPD